MNFRENYKKGEQKLFCFFFLFECVCVTVYVCLLSPPASLRCINMSTKRTKMPTIINKPSFKVPRVEIFPLHVNEKPTDRVVADRAPSGHEDVARKTEKLLARATKLAARAFGRITMYGSMMVAVFLYLILLYDICFTYFPQDIFCPSFNMF